MAQPAVTRRLAAIVAADIVGYSRIMSEDEAGTLLRLKEITEELLEPTVREHGGRLVKTTGDGALLEFPSAVDALVCAVAVQRELALREAEVQSENRIRYRIGINVGEIIHDGDDIFGDGVNVAARLEGLAEPGGIRISEAVFNNVKGKLDLGFADLGPQTVKNIAEPIQTYRVLLDPDDAGKLIHAHQDKPKRKWLPAVVVVAFAAVVAAGWLGWERSGGLDPSVPGEPRLLVLPFKASNDEAQVYADGATENLLATFTRLRGLTVVPRHVALRYKGMDPNISKLREEHDFDFVIDGSVELRDQKLTVSGRLRAASGQSVWSEPADGVVEDAFGLLAKLKSRTMASLQIPLNDRERKRISRQPTSAMDAYVAFAEAERHLNYGEWTATRDALSGYQRALEIDPDFIDAKVGLANTNFRIWVNSWGAVKNTPTAERDMVGLIENILSEDRKNPSALAIRTLRTLNLLQQDRALREARTAVFAFSDEPRHLYPLAFALTAVGEYEEATSELDRYVKLAPRLLPRDIHDVALLYLRLGEPEKASALLSEIPKFLQNTVAFHQNMAEALSQLGDTDAARAELRKSLEIAAFQNINWYKPSFAVYKDPEVLKRFVETMRAAGMSDWPYQFDEENAEHKLGPEKMRAFVEQVPFRDVDGTGPFGQPYSRTLKRDGTFELDFKWQPAIAGTWRLDDDKICFRSESAYMNREFCNLLFFDPESPASGRQRYYQLDIFGYYNFAVERIGDE